MRPLTVENLLQAYQRGLFPMAESADSQEIFWVEPQWRGVIPLDGLYLSTSLRKVLRAPRFDIRLDHDFFGVISACALPQSGREKTWINAQIIDVYHTLFQQGLCHTLEVYQEGQLVGGLYGLALGGAFFGESMFHFVSNASKIALVHLVARLKLAGYVLLDTQFITSHLHSLGAIEMPQQHYKQLLKQALPLNPAPLQAFLTGAQALEIVLEGKNAP